MKRYLLLFLCLVYFFPSKAQQLFPYEIQLISVNINGLPGLHSFAYAKHENTWLLIGGRKDGLHARQPFNSFPQSQNNTTLYVVDIVTKQIWSKELTELSVGMKEQLQSTNMNFHQVGDTLYIIGGYAFSPTANNHITFPNLTTIQVSEVIQAIKQNNPIGNFFKQYSDQQFAVTGGHLVHINDTFLLVGGHRFDGRYNPMGNPTYTQSYTNQVRRFFINNSGSAINVNHITPITDEIHLHRRDYNLIPRIDKNEQLGFTISSGVFQANADLPFLYPVDINSNFVNPITSFNQYLSNYHSAVASLFESQTKTQYTLFFGGMSRYFYQGDSLIQDNNVPFTNTISAIKRTSDTDLIEIKLPITMPSLKGASAEFILNESVPTIQEEFIDLNNITSDTVSIGYIVGGIQSSSLNPFTNNQTSTTSADNTLFEVKLIKKETNTGVELVKSTTKLTSRIYPNPAKEDLHIYSYIPTSGTIYFTWSDESGRIIKEELFSDVSIGWHTQTIKVPSQCSSKKLMLTIDLNHVYFESQWIELIK